ncbi:2-keto-4-pentenoate hydratase [Conexibacter woesei]|uniref:2-hydroxypenta-2,4-dienoate hydratase (BphH) n=1 Tax=Conexibacter woesei (strain DSM 14684 / CCUG 47730 / CIP 108061 / JCM 11494 / NBRC 100937 / ID131577) TaxID=469383 RepID=D3F3P9_CONWI|nr:2-hydroxypenta-2,4-dienoate hydratase [Conexibacter woesei]ADB52414.1 2-hydroxypenta-2,4-dienoate hydratase (BphH) [Conexibacter woesei DSM 14684]
MPHASADTPEPGLTPREHRRLAEVLLKAMRERRAIEPLSRRYPELTPADGERIRDALADRRVAGGERRLGATADACEEPPARFGWITSEMLLDRDAFELGGLIRPRVEAKLAFRLHRALPAAPTARDLLAATGRVLPALEVRDSRYGCAVPSPADAMADNCAVTLVRLGAGGPPPAEHALDGLGLTVEHDGAPVAGAARPSPVESVLWLVRRLVATGAAPRAGTLLVSAPCASVHAPVAGTLIRAYETGLGAVELRGVMTETEVVR